MKKYKPKQCRACGELFTPVRSTTEVACSVICAMAIAKKKQQDKRKAETRKKKQEFNQKDIKWQKAKAQRIFNEYIRERDKHEPCISCGRMHNGKWDAGHYKTRGAHPELAFDEQNCHKQCNPCNTHLSGNINNYRANLVLKIGEASVLELERYHPPVKFSIDDYIGLQKKFQNKLKSLRDRTSAQGET